MDKFDKAHYPFYSSFLESLLRERSINRDDSVLVLCAGPLDARVVSDLGFTDVTLSNLSDGPDGDSKFAWARVDAEAIDLPDNHVDLVLAHAGLHHCASPHTALAEMYRVARKAVVFVEPNDSLVTRVGARLGFGQTYEHAAVVGNGYVEGGMRNGPIPNYVWRWSPAEITKAVASLDPAYEPEVRCTFGAALHEHDSHTFLKRLILKVAVRVLQLVPSQGNKIGAYVAIAGPDTPILPWIRRTEHGVEPDREYLDPIYSKQ